VRIDALDLTAVGDARIAVSVRCSKGTYVRVLAERIATCLGSVGHLEALRRTRFGPFSVEDAVTLQGLARGAVPLIGLRKALPHLREIVLDAEATVRARQGYTPLLAGIPAGVPNETAKLVGADGELAAVIVTDAAGRWRFARVIAASKRIAS